MKFKDIKNITLIEADRLYKELGVALIIKHGEIKGFTR